MDPYPVHRVVSVAATAGALAPSDPVFREQMSAIGKLSASSTLTPIRPRLGAAEAAGTKFEQLIAGVDHSVSLDRAERPWLPGKPGGLDL